MTAEHYADADILADGYASVRFVCTGGDEDGCRQWCADGCEESCLARDIVLWPDRVPVDRAPDDLHQWAPTPKIGESSCREMDWLDACGWQDSGWVDDEEEGGEREMEATDLRPGRHRIEVEWTGDDYIWRYPAEVTT